MGGIRRGARCLAYPTAPPLAVTPRESRANMPCDFLARPTIVMRYNPTKVCEVFQGFIVLATRMDRQSHVLKGCRVSGLQLSILLDRGFSLKHLMH